MSSTYRTLETGQPVGSDAEQLFDGSASPVAARWARVVLTGTQLQTLFSSPATVIPSIPGKSIVVLGFNTAFTYGGVAYGTNVSIELIVGAGSNGTATNAINGTNNTGTAGVIISSTNVQNTALQARVATGNPTGGNAAAQLVVNVNYMLL
jgi:hypothetical protein